jgi:hypothetical protein
LEKGKKKKITKNEKKQEDEKQARKKGQDCQSLLKLFSGK